jgi:hypothetical protein
MAAVISPSIREEVAQHEAHTLDVSSSGYAVNKGHTRPEAGYRGGADMCNANHGEVCTASLPHSLRSEAFARSL